MYSKVKPKESIFLLFLGIYHLKGKTTIDGFIAYILYLLPTINNQTFVRLKIDTACYLKIYIKSITRLK